MSISFFCHQLAVQKEQNTINAQIITDIHISYMYGSDNLGVDSVLFLITIHITYRYNSFDYKVVEWFERSIVGYRNGHQKCILFR